MTNSIVWVSSRRKTAYSNMRGQNCMIGDVIFGDDTEKGPCSNYFVKEGGLDKL